MYLPNHFAQTDATALHALMRGYPLGTLVTQADGELVADELPFLFIPTFGGHGALRAHVARANPLWQAHPANCKVLVIFRGPQAYVSPGWYPAKQENGKVVPTWNYTVVQASGHLRVVDGDAAWLRAQLEALTQSQEGVRPEPWQVDDAPADYIARMMGAVVGLEIEITALVGKFKLSQNHPPEARRGVMRGLADEPAQAAHQVASRMA
jgi:transcriptional regulator